MLKNMKKCPKKVYDFQYFVKMKRKIYVMQHVFGIFVVPLRAFLGQRKLTLKKIIKRLRIRCSKTTEIFTISQAVSL